jgi:predicted nucleic acid-binding protein
MARVHEHTITDRAGPSPVGLADVSIVVLAGRYRTDRVLTLDERHFRALRTPQGASFTILPADA